MFNWFAARDDVNKRIAELEDRISSLRQELRRATTRTIESTKVERILAIREQELERTKVYVEFIEHKLATGPFRAPPRR